MMRINPISISLKKAILCTALVIMIHGCNSPDIDDNEPKVPYRAINKDDTAIFKVKLTEKEFHGQFEINYHGIYKDSGDVNGIIKGDTLLGTFHFQSYGVEKWYRIPIALLKKNDKLIMGVGSMEIYMNMTFFTKNIPIDYQHPKFIFEKLN
jgi:hypothetical protein